MSFVGNRSELLNETVLSPWDVPSLNSKLNVNKSPEPDGIHPPLLQELMGRIVARYLNAVPIFTNIEWIASLNSAQKKDSEGEALVFDQKQAGMRKDLIPRHVNQKSHKGGLNMAFSEGKLAKCTGFFDARDE